MADTPRVTVVTPCYNSLRFLPETVDAILGQTYTDFELVLVDDGGEDDLAGWVGGLGDDRVRLVRQENSGAAAARNRGVAEGVGELVAFCDSDDLWTTRTLEALVIRYDEAQAAAPPGREVGLVYGWYHIVRGDGTPTGHIGAYTAEGDAWPQFVLHNPVGTSATLVPRAVFEAVGGFAVNDELIRVDVEDWDLWLRIADQHLVAVVPEVLYDYRRHEENTSSDVAGLDVAYRNLLRNTFEGQPRDRLALRSQAVAQVEIILGWHSLNDDRDPARALAYRRSARRHHPGTMTWPDYWRLGAAARAMSVAGDSGFEVVRSGAQGVRRTLGLRRT